MATTVGTVQYDAIINLDSLRPSLAEADKLVEKSYKTQANLAKKYASSGSNTTGSARSEAEARIASIKQEAQSTAQTLAQYTPQIQKQFLTVERANNSVVSATERSMSAIQRYGDGSMQATKATNSLSVAVQNQSQQQSKLDAMLNGTYKSQNSFTQSLNESALAVGGLVAAFVSLQTITTAIQNGVQAANTYEAAMVGISNIAIKFGQDSNAATSAAKELANDGLITVSTAANGLQKLMQGGLNLPQAIELMKGYKNQAAFGRSNTIGFDQAVGNLAESFYTQNSAIGNLSGQSENWNQIIEEGARVLGKQVSELSKAELIQAKYLGQIQLNNLVQGDSAKYAETAAGGQAQLNAAFIELNETLGQVINNLSGGIIQGLAEFITNNSSVLVAIGAGVAAFALLTGGIVAATVAMKALNAAMNANPILLALSIALSVGVALFTWLSSIGQKAEETTESIEDLVAASAAINAENTKNLNSAMKALGEASAKTAKQIAKVEKSIAEVNEQYRYNLAELVKSKNDNIAALLDELNEEKAAYDNAYRERLTSFEKSQNEEELTHQAKVDSLRKQIDFLSKYNTTANRKQVEELKFALEQENNEYKKSTDLRQSEFDAQTQSQLSEYEKRRQEAQKSLDAEVALLEKHRDEVASVRNVMLLDEIQSLQKSRNAQLENLNQQKADILASNAGVIQGLVDQVAQYRRSIEEENERMRKAIMMHADNVTSAYNKLMGGVYNFGTGLYEAPKTTTNSSNRSGTFSWWNLLSTFTLPKFVDDQRGYAEGGYTGRGGRYDIAGTVHAGEYVLPRESVDQNTGLPDWDKIIGNMGQNVTVNVTMSGIMSSSKTDERAIASRFGKLINEVVKSNTGKVAINGLQNVFN